MPRDYGTLRDAAVSSPRRRYAPLLARAAAVVGVAAIGMRARALQGGAVTSLGALDATAEGVTDGSADSVPTATPTAAPTLDHLTFELYKHAISVRNGTAAEIRDFVNATISHLDPNYDLGCDGVKVNAYLLPYGPQLHWVDASALSNDPHPIEEWQPRFEALNGNLSQWNAFMHNKVTMFLPDLMAPLRQLRNTSAPLMFRRGTGYSGHVSEVGELGHVLFPIAGRIYEMVGPITSTMVSETRDWPEWTSSECPASHRLDDDLDQYVSKYQQYVVETKLLFSQMEDWATERGYYPPMLAGISVAAAAGDSTGYAGTLVDDLAEYASIGSRVEYSSDKCSVTRISTITSHGFKAPVRYVTNVVANRILESAADAAGTQPRMTVLAYNDYIQSAHSAITGSYAEWAGWDHWLDAHIGLKYVGSEPCAHTDALNGNLSLSSLSVGQRTTADYGSAKATHWYTGYPGSLAWEYWVLGCTYGSVNDNADVCACVASNNDKTFLLEHGYNCTATGLNDWLS